MRNPIDARTYDGRWWTILQGYLVEWGEGNREEVKAGLRTDFASIPRLFWRICPPWGLSMRGAAAHDQIYNDLDTKWTRQEADRMFYEVMRQDGVPLWQAQTMYRAVQTFGWIRWNKVRKV